FRASTAIDRTSGRQPGATPMVAGKAAERPRQEPNTETQPERRVEFTTDDMLQAKTLKGDVRDRFLATIKALQKPWSKLSAIEQQAINDDVEFQAGVLVNAALHLIATRGFEYFEAMLGEFKINPKTGIEAKIGLRNTDEALIGLNQRRFQSVLLIAHDP